MNLRAEALGYPSKYAITNLGAILVYLILASCLVLIVVLILSIASRVFNTDGVVIKFAKNFMDKT